MFYYCQTNFEQLISTLDTDTSGIMYYVQIHTHTHIEITSQNYSARLFLTNY